MTPEPEDRPVPPTTIVVKVSRPLNKGAEAAEWLIYSRDRSISLYMPLAKVPSGLRAAMGNEAKIYVEAMQNEDGMVFGRKVANQLW